MNLSELLSSAKQESAQVFVLSVGAVYWLWSKGAPDVVLVTVGGLGAAFIVAEKVRAIFRPKP